MATAVFSLKAASFGEIKLKGHYAHADAMLPMRSTRSSHLRYRKRYRELLSLSIVSDHGHYVSIPYKGRVAPKWLEVDMPVSRKEVRGGKVYAAPLFGIAFLMAFYWLMTDWHDLPAVINAAIAAMHWPT